ncbi:MAG: HAD-IC family P-type ATPase [Nitrospirota bacterium]|nr:HAD-IC family P-type ATPase [Nitrospirota bacterium]
MTKIPSPSFPESTEGLSSEEATRRLETAGPNAVTLPRSSRSLLLIEKFWGPVPWMLETGLGLEVFLGKNLEAAIIGALLVMNALLAFFSQQRGEKALELLQSHLEIRCRAKRDGLWQIIPARTLVPGDLVHVRMGDFVPADLVLLSGNPLLDQSSLTGESLPVETKPGDTLWSGSVVRRGEGHGSVVRTGARCAWGKTAMLVHDTHTRSHFEEVVLQIVSWLLAIDVFLALILFPLAIHAGMSPRSLVPFILILLISAIPVALPPAFALANAFSAAYLSRKGVLVTRLSSISDAAAMKDLLSDKTGTLTENRLKVKGVYPEPGIGEQDLLDAAMAASDMATQDPLDMALFNEIQARGYPPVPEDRQISFTPFDPATKRTEALIKRANGLPFRIVKGSPLIMPDLGIPYIAPLPVDQGGQRTIAVARGEGVGPLRFLGLITFSDTLRHDSIPTVRALKSLGIKVRLVTGDTCEAALPIARSLGISGVPCPGNPVESGRTIEDCELFAGVLPRDKFRIVTLFQKKGRIVGMTGDGVNDAAALRQAEVGIAVSTATDIARASAGLILVNPGLSGLTEAIVEGRRVFHRMQNYILNKIVKTLEVALFLTGGLLVFHTYVVSSRMVLLLVFTNDFVTMALASDHVRISEKPDRWNIRSLVLTALLISGLWLGLTMTVFYAGMAWFHLPPASCRTLGFLTLVLTGLGNVLVIRERGPFWKSRPAAPLLLAMGGDMLIAGTLSATHLLLTPLPFRLVLALLLLVVVATFVIDRIKGITLSIWGRD